MEEMMKGRKEEKEKERRKEKERKRNTWERENKQKRTNKQTKTHSNIILNLYSGIFWGSSWRTLVSVSPHESFVNSPIRLNPVVPV